MDRVKGVTLGELAGLEAGILALACPGMARTMDRMRAWREAGVTDEEIAEASALASETAYSVDDWLAALRRVRDYLKRADGGPGREAIVKAIRDVSAYRAHGPNMTAWMLLGDEVTSGALNAYVRPRNFPHGVVVRPETITRMEAAARGHRP